MANEREYVGRCFCGAVEVKVTGAPAAMGYCHCSSCRAWSAGRARPAAAFARHPARTVAARSWPSLRAFVAGAVVCSVA